MVIAVIVSIRDLSFTISQACCWENMGAEVADMRRYLIANSLNNWNWWAFKRHQLRGSLYVLLSFCNDIRGSACLCSSSQIVQFFKHVMKYIIIILTNSSIINIMLLLLIMMTMLLVRITCSTNLFLTNGHMIYLLLKLFLLSTSVSITVSYSFLWYLHKCLSNILVLILSVQWTCL